jgi:AraC-like DNA-binding protein
MPDSGSRAVEAPYARRGKAYAIRYAVRVVRDDFEPYAKRAVRRLEIGPGGVQEIELVVDGPPMSSQGRFVRCDGITFMLGENSTTRDMSLRGEHAEPQVAIQVSLRGSAVVTMDGLAAPLGGVIGEVELFATPPGRRTVSLHADVTNQAFRISFTEAKLHALASRFDLVAQLASGKPFHRARAMPSDVAPWIAEVMDSAHLGSARPMFLEARAIDWLATLLAPDRAQSPLTRRELDRVHEARAILIARSGDPPTLAELASEVGTNETTLKRNFKLVFGQPPYAFVLAHRLGVARRMLADTDLSIKEIAAAIGYAHASHFTTAFRRQFGITPWQHRRRCR